MSDQPPKTQQNAFADPFPVTEEPAPVELAELADAHRILEAWGTKNHEGRVVFHLTDSNGKEERWETSPVFARDLSNRLMHAAAKAQQTLQGQTGGDK